VIWLKNLLEVLAILIKVSDGVGNLLGDFFVDLLKSGGNPVAIGVATLNLINGFAGVVLAAAGTFYFDLAARFYEKGAGSSATEDLEGKPYQHVMTPAQSLRWIELTLGSTIQAMTLTGKQDLADIIFGAIGRFIWRLLKPGIIRNLLKLLKFTTEAEFVSFFSKKVSDAITSVQFKAILAALAAALVLMIAVVSQLIFVGLTIVEPTAWKQFVLYPSHPRQKERVRILRRVGGVRP